MNLAAFFLSTPPSNWDSKQWYQQIIRVVESGLGLQLLLTSSTEYVAQKEGFAEEMKLADQDLREEC